MSVVLHSHTNTLRMYLLVLYMTLVRIPAVMNKYIVCLCLCMFMLYSDIIFLFVSFVSQVMSYLEAGSKPCLTGFETQLLGQMKSTKYFQIHKSIYIKAFKFFFL